MNPELVHGLFIMFMTVIVLWALWVVCGFLFRLQTSWTEFMHNDNKHWSDKCLLFIPWAILSIFVFVLLMLCAMAAISLAKDACNWMNDKD